MVTYGSPGPMNPHKGGPVHDDFYYALVSHPGHHAGPSSVGGYCYINNAAILAKDLLRLQQGRASPSISVNLT